MAAGQGFKTFTTGEVLTAGDVNGYLMQGINVFATTAARDAAITAPAEGQFAFTKDTNGLWYYDGAAWVASGATGDIEGVTAGVGISGGGTSGTVTVTNSMATAIDAKGDLVPGTGADTFARLAVGANGTVLTADSTAATGLKWATPAAAGGMTLLSTTSITAANAINVTSINQTYTNLVVYVENFAMNTNQTNIFFRFNNDSSAIYDSAASNSVNSAFLYQTGATSMFVGGYANLGNSGNNTLVIQIPFYSTSAAYKTVDFNLMSNYGTSGKINAGGFVGYGSTSAITEFNLFAGGGTNFASQGNIKIYGVN